jgi:hypothetical protein
MTATLTDIFRTLPGGAAVASQSNIIDVFLATDDSTLTADIDTDADGLWSWTYSPAGSAATSWTLNPGGIYWTGVYAGQTRKGSNLASGMWGPNSIAELPILFSAFGDGVVAGALSGDFAVTYDAAGLDVDIAAGKALLDGILVTNPSSRELTIAAADATHPRIDRIILELTRTAGDTYGKVVLKVLSGTAAASPVAPTLTDSASTLQISLAQVRVNALATTVASVTDERAYALTSITRNPTLMATLLTGPTAGSPLTTTGSVSAPLQHSITLVSGVTYDISIDAEITADGTSAVAQMACYIEGTSNASDYVTAPAQSGILSLRNAHTRSVVGTGAAITAGVLAKRSSTDSVVNYYGGTSRVLAIPR